MDVNLLLVSGLQVSSSILKDALSHCWLSLLMYSAKTNVLKFSSGSFTVSSLLILFELIFVFIRQVSVSFFYIRTFIFPSNTIIWRHYQLLFVYSWHPCRTSVDPIYLDLYMALYSVPLVCTPVLMLTKRPYCLCYCSFALFQSQEM